MTSKSRLTENWRHLWIDRSSMLTSRAEPIGSVGHGLPVESTFTGNVAAGGTVCLQTVRRSRKRSLPFECEYSCRCATRVASNPCHPAEATLRPRFRRRHPCKTPSPAASGQTDNENREPVSGLFLRIFVTDICSFLPPTLVGGPGALA